jgi:hypothetical protein
VKLGASWVMPDSRVPRTISFDPKPSTFGYLMVVVLVEHPTVCLGLPCKVINQSIISLSPLYETT